jgi:LmbE family N-acetylglucosaminyl deacetylase
VKTRVKESQDSDKILGGKGVMYLAVNEGKFIEEAKDRNIKEKLMHIIKEKKPSKIFTHSIDDPHPDHKAVYNIVMELVEEIKYAGDVYSFNIWNPINIRKRHLPKLVVNITETFKKKREAFTCHNSQKATFFTLVWSVYLQNFLDGLKNRCRFAEVFYKVR